LKEKVVIIGGGAAGFFAAINIAEKNRNAEVIILEKSNKLLYKVEISGGGRCNVSHHCFEPSVLVKNYPRGNKELLSVFMKFQPLDTINWFQKRGVPIKSENDGRMFPASNTSSSIIDCFLALAKKLKVVVETSCEVQSLYKNKDNTWLVTTSKNQKIIAAKVIVCTGSSLRMWKLLEEINHPIEAPVPSLFTFNIKEEQLNKLMGISISNASIHIKGTKLQSLGPLLITHWGISGPAVLKLSAWGARELANLNYKFEVEVNWTGILKLEEVKELILSIKKDFPKKQLSNTVLLGFTNRFWLYLLNRIQLDETKKWADINATEINKLTQNLVNTNYVVTGKSTFKDEFVTCGGVSLKDVDFKSMESKQHKNLFFAGEILNIDAITGGFNFQAAWSTAWIVSESCASSITEV
jgi:predicted Rossmann fold flavoprotein